LKPFGSDKTRTHQSLRVSLTESNRKMSINYALYPAAYLVLDLIPIL
jgi:cysteine sulfinate desulfinase/cysteine desulfurase-like protein